MPFCAALRAWDKITESKEWNRFGIKIAGKESKIYA
jgi:hypothetical protein